MPAAAALSSTVAFLLLLAAPASAGRLLPAAAAGATAALAGAAVTPQSLMRTWEAGLPLLVPRRSIVFTTSIPCAASVRRGGCAGGGKLSARLDDAAEDDVFAVKVRSWDSGDKELAAVGVRARVGHAELSCAAVLVLEVLVGKLGAVDALAARAVVVGEVAALP